MRADWSSNAIIGVRIKNPRVQSKRRGCRHPEQNTQFCSECGHPMWETSTEISPKLGELLGDSEHPSGLKVCYSTDNEEFFVGMYVAYSGSNRSSDGIGWTELPPVINTREIKVKLMDYLGDLYNEKEFGLWTVMSSGDADDILMDQTRFSNN